MWKKSITERQINLTIYDEYTVYAVYFLSNTVTCGQGNRRPVQRSPVFSSIRLHKNRGSRFSAYAVYSKRKIMDLKNESIGNKQKRKNLKKTNSKKNESADSKTADVRLMKARPVKKKNKQNKLLYMILLVFFAAVLVIVSVLMLRDRHTEKTAEELYRDLGTKGKQTDDSKTSYVDSGDTVLSGLGIKVPDKDLDWDLMKKTNQDIYAWIYIPGTNVDYPIVQHPEDNAYYLEHNLDGSEGYPGCIFTENYNSKDFRDRNTVIYGHDMKDGSMFDTLHDYEDEAFFQENRYVFIYLPAEILVYDIFAAYESGAEHILSSHNFLNDDRYQEYLDGIFQMRDMGAHLRGETKAAVQNRIITLSTCIDMKPDSRYLVQGVLINDPASVQ